MKNSYIIIGSIVIVLILIVILIFKFSNKTVDEQASGNDNSGTGNGGGGSYSPGLQSTGFPLKRGSKGVEVQNLQLWLKDGLTTDGIFGRKTETSLMKKTNKTFMDKTEYDVIFKELMTYTTGSSYASDTIGEERKKYLIALTTRIANDINDTPFSGHNINVWNEFLALNDIEITFISNLYKNYFKVSLFSAINDEWNFLNKDKSLSRLRNLNLL